MTAARPTCTPATFDALHATWQAAGLDVSEVADQPWGMREFSVLDPGDRSVYSPSSSAMMRTMAGPTRRFTATVVSNAKRRVLVPLPFAPDDAWGHKPSHPVAGSVNGMGVRAVVEAIDDGWAIVLGPAWRRDCGIAPGDEVDVVLYPEGPQRDDLAEDIAAALAAEPDAAAFFDGLAQFYRRAYLRWIDATKRRPDERERRISEMIDLLRRGEKERT